MLNLTPSEKRTIFIICGVLILAGLCYLIGPFENKEIAIDYSESDSIFSRLSHRPITRQTVHQNTDKETKNNYNNVFLKSDPKPKAVEGSININLADESELKKLPRIGPAMAKRIIQYRNKNGPFTSINDLTAVKGIGKKTLKLIRPYLSNIE